MKMNDPFHQTTDLDHPTACLNAAVRRTARAMANAYDTALSDSGLSGPQFTLLSRLTLTGPVPIKTLASTIGVDRTTLSRTLRPLIAKGLLREQAGDDRRVKRISITQRGAQALARAELDWRKVQQATVEAFGAANAEELFMRLSALERAANIARDVMADPQERPAAPARSA